MAPGKEKKQTLKAVKDRGGGSRVVMTPIKDSMVLLGFPNTIGGHRNVEIRQKLFLFLLREEKKRY